MQQFGYSKPSESIPLNEDEARAIAELHAKRQEVQGQPTLGSLAAQLGISEAEAAALLTEVRAKVPPAPVAATPPFAPPMQAPPTHHRRVPLAVWAVAAAVVVCWIGVVGFFALRATQPEMPMAGQPTTPAIAFDGGEVVKVAPMPPRANVYIERHGPDGTTIIRTPGADVEIPDLKDLTDSAREMRAKADEMRAKATEEASRADIERQALGR